MRTRAAVLSECDHPEPCEATLPHVIEDPDPPGEGGVLVEVVGAGLCHYELATINGSRPRPMPMVPGPKASGIVRETGPGVAGFKADDHVAFSFVPMCGRCLCYATGRPALCEAAAAANVACTLPGGGVHFLIGPDRVLHHPGVSGLSRCTIATQESRIKIDRLVPLRTSALFGCVILMGVGAATNTARVAPSEVVASFGLDGVGLGAAMGARLAGAYPIIAVDTQPAKFPMARKLGAHHAIGLNDDDVASAIADPTRGGMDYAFEAVGSAALLASAYDDARRGATAVSVGLPQPGQVLSILAVFPVAGEKGIRGSYRARSCPGATSPRLIGLAQGGALGVEELLSPSIRPEGINVGFDRLADGSAVRQPVQFDGPAS